MKRILAPVFLAGITAMLTAQATVPTAGHFSTAIRPQITITSLHKTKQPDYTLTGTIKGASAITNLAYSLNDGPEQAVNVASPFNIVFSLTPGTTDISLTAWDAAGHAGSARISVIYTPPPAKRPTTSPTQLGPVGKYMQAQMKKIRKIAASPATPAKLPSAEQGLAEMQSGMEKMKKALTAAGVSMNSDQAEEGTGNGKTGPPPKPVDSMAPLLQVTSPDTTVSANYLLAGIATDDTGVASVTYALNGGQPQALKLDHGRFQAHLTLKHGTNNVSLVAADAAKHKTSKKMQVKVTNPTSDNLIDAAVKKGELDRNTALLYKVYAGFGDSRLPHQYHGDDSKLVDNHSLDAAAIQFPVLPEAIQRKLVAFFMPPYYQGSWFDQELSSQLAYTRTESTDELATKRLFHLVPAVFTNYYQGINTQPISSSTFRVVMASQSMPATSSGSSGQGAGVPPCMDQHWYQIADCKKSDKWKYVDGAHVRVWYVDKMYPSDTTKPQHTSDWVKFNGLAKAQALLLRDQIEKKIWPKLTKLMHRQPLSDLGMPLNGGDGRLDVALSPGILHNTASFLGLTIEYLPFLGHYHHIDCGPRPVYIILRRTLPFDTLKSDTSHELMHAIQYTYHTKGCLVDYSWLMESTAVWAQDYVYPKDNWEHWLAAKFIHHPQISLELANSSHEYWSYLFFFFLSHHFKEPALIRKTWEATTQETNGIQAVAKALKESSKKLSKVFPEFTVYNFNDGPVQEYTTWDGIEATPKYDLQSVPLGPDGDKLVPLIVDMKHLTSKYRAFKFADSSIRTVAIYNGYRFKLSKKIRSGAGDIGPEASKEASADVSSLDALPPAERKGRHLETLVEMGDHWYKNPKTGKPYTDLGPGFIFCRTGNDPLKAVVLIPSNSRLPGNGNALKPIGLPPLLYESNMACGPWKGTITTVRHDNDVTWTFTTKIHSIGASGHIPEILPMMTDAQLQHQNVTTSSSASLGGAGSGSGGGLDNLFSGPMSGGPHLNPYFGQIVWFISGTTNWQATSACGTTKGSYKNLGAILTYNFVPSGQLYRHYLLTFAPMASFGLPYKGGTPDGGCYEDTSYDPASGAYAGTIEKDGVEARNKVNDGNTTVTYDFHLDTEASSTSSAQNH